MNKQERTTTNMLYDEIMKIVTLAGELMLQAQDEELTVFDKEGTANFVTKHDKEIQFYLIQNLRQLILWIKSTFNSFSAIFL